MRQFRIIVQAMLRKRGKHLTSAHKILILLSLMNVAQCLSHFALGTLLLWNVGEETVSKVMLESAVLFIMHVVDYGRKSGRKLPDLLRILSGAGLEPMLPRVFGHLARAGDLRLDWNAGKHR